MTPDLRWLVWTLVLAFAQLVIAAALRAQEVGLPAQLGNREGLPPAKGLAGRAERAHRNMMESLPLFIGLVMAAHLSGKADGMALVGCVLFFYARLAHAAFYLLGTIGVRTLCWAASVAGLVLILARLLA